MTYFAIAYTSNWLYFIRFLTIESILNLKILWIHQRHNKSSTFLNCMSSLQCLPAKEKNIIIIEIYKGLLFITVFSK
jgi:hypothetical protein